MAQTLAEKEMRTVNLRNRFVFFAVVPLLALAISGCGVAGSVIDNVTGLVGLNETGTVINQSYIRSSYAVVAADLLQVKRGQKLDILEETEFEKVHWYRVRASDEAGTEGWIEAQNLITETLLEKSQKLAAEDKDLQPQATAQLRAPTNLRLTPEQNGDNILFKLSTGATFDVVGWKYVPKVQEEVSDVDDASNKPFKTPKTKNAEIEAARESDAPEDLADKYDIWYKVRLDPIISPAPAGWVFGRQIILQIPNDIVFYQPDTRKFIAWQRLDAVETDRTPGKDNAAKTTRPGSWVVLTRSDLVKSKDGNEPDFDGIIVFGYDKYNEDHYTAYRNDHVTGSLPFRVDGTGDSKSFSVRVLNTGGQLEEKRFVVFKDAKGRLKVTPPPDISTK